MARSAKPPRPRGRRPAPAAAAGEIQCWTTDPMGGVPPLILPAPDLPGAALPTRIVAPAPAPPAQIHATATTEFRYWTAAEPLRRGAAFWSGAGAAAWAADIGAALPVRLDDGVDLNAYYARNDFPPQGIKQGLSFFHDTVRDVSTGQPVAVFSGESPDIVAHELGHAVLDALKPALWGVATTEVAAFHESFGDMSAILIALQLPAVRQAVLEETGGRLWRNSSVSRVAEQLGYAIRQRSPASVDPDSLRNAANSFVYADPLTLPASGPASGLSRRPHNFSRIFTGAFLEALGGMALTLADPPGVEEVLQVSQDMGQLLVRAVVNAPVRTRFFQAVAEQLVLADAALFEGRYADALTTAFVRRGLLAVRALAAPAAAAAAAEPAAAAAEPVRVALDGASLGLAVPTVYTIGPAVDDGPPAGAALGVADAGPGRRYSAAQAFVEDLVIRGRVALGPRLARAATLLRALTRSRPTHQLVRVDDGVELQRVAFDCGC